MPADRQGTGTHATPVAAAAATLTAGQPSAPSCNGLVDVAAPPPELPAVQVQRAADYVARHPIRYATHMEAITCTATFFQKPPPPGQKVIVGSQPPADRFVDVTTGRLLQRTPDGILVESEVPCLQGFGHPDYRTFALDGTELCTTYANGAHIPDPTLPPAQPGASPGSGLGPFGFGNPAGGRGRGGLSLNVGGVDVGSALQAFLGGGGSVDLSGVLAVLAALVVQGGNIRQSLDGVPLGVGDALGPGFGSLADRLDGLAPGLGGRLVSALTDQGNITADEAARVGANIIAAFIPGAAGMVQAVTGGAAETLKQIPGLFKRGADALLEHMLTVFRDKIEAKAPVTPETVADVAKGAVEAALAAGTTAHLVALGLELLHPVKHMGVPQLVGVLSEFAGFTAILKPYYEATLRHGIGLPAEHRAAAHFRSVLPPLETVRELAASLPGLLQKYHERLELAGYPDPYPAALVDQVYTPPPARFLANLLDGSEADRPWLAAKLRRLGFSPEDTERAVKGLELKTTAPGRGRIVAQLVDQYVHGRLPAADLDAGLEGAGLSVTHRAYYRRAADLERRGARMEAIATAVLAAYRNQTVTTAVARQELTALGFADDEVTVRLTAADLAIGRQQVQAEVKELDAELRALKSRGLTLALRQLRAGFLTVAQFHAVGQGMGYSAALLDVAAGTALLQGAPTSTAADPAIGLGALEEIRARMAAIVTAEVQAKRTDRVAALGALVGLGLPHDLATLLTDLADAIAGPDARPGDYGLRTGARLGGGFDAIVAGILGGVKGVPDPTTLFAELLGALHLPVRDRAAIVRLIQDLRDLFHR